MACHASGTQVKGFSLVALLQPLKRITLASPTAQAVLGFFSCVLFDFRLVDAAGDFRDFVFWRGEMYSGWKGKERGVFVEADKACSYIVQTQAKPMIGVIFFFLDNGC